MRIDKRVHGERAAQIFESRISKETQVSVKFILDNFLCKSMHNEINTMCRLLILFFVCNYSDMNGDLESEEASKFKGTYVNHNEQTIYICFVCASIS